MSAPLSVYMSVSSSLSIYLSLSVSHYIFLSISFLPFHLYLCWDLSHVFAFALWTILSFSLPSSPYLSFLSLPFPLNPSPSPSLFPRLSCASHSLLSLPSSLPHFSPPPPPVFFQTVFPLCFSLSLCRPLPLLLVISLPILSHPISVFSLSPPLSLSLSVIYTNYLFLKEIWFKWTKMTSSHIQFYSWSNFAASFYNTKKCFCVI